MFKDESFGDLLDRINEGREPTSLHVRSIFDILDGYKYEVKEEELYDWVENLSDKEYFKLKNFLIQADEKNVMHMLKSSKLRLYKLSKE